MGTASGSAITSTVTAIEVIGRDRELAQIDGFLSDPAACALVLDGEPGIGKTTLWLAAVERARANGSRVLCARPAEIEASFAFAGLRDLLRDVDHSARAYLPEPQRHALAVALAEDEVPKSPLEAGVVGAALLGLLSGLTLEQPLLLAIDDLQWLDEASGAVIVYALRRLASRETRLLVSCRAKPAAPLPFELERALDPRPLSRIRLTSLSVGAIGRLLRRRISVNLARRELHAVFETSRGNPFFALELGRVPLDLDQSGALRLPGDLLELVGARLRELPESTHRALLFVAALADPTQRILERAGIDDVLGPAVEADVLELDDGRVRFTHPIVASAAWQAADPEKRREVHRALADVVDDLEQRARHLALATRSADVDIARLLETAATVARGRGAPATAADLLDRARELTPPGELGLWAGLAAAAATAHAEAGHFDSVQELVDEAQARLPAGLGRAEILVAAAEMRPGLDSVFHQALAEAGETAVGARAWIGLATQAAFGGHWREAVENAREAERIARNLDDTALLGVALTFVGGMRLIDSQRSGVREIAEALAIERALGALPTTSYESPRLWHACALQWSDDCDRARPLLQELLTIASERGDEMSAFQTMHALVLAESQAGNWESARSIGREALDRVETLGYEYGRPILLGALAKLEAVQGNLDRSRVLGQDAVAALTAFGDRLWSTFALASLLFTELCAGDTVAALGHADAISSRFPDGRECWWSYHQGDEIEALVLAHEYERARTRVEALRRAGDELGLPRFLAWAGRGEGLIRSAQGDLPAAESALVAAIEQHARFPSPFERARTLLAYGHVLRRARRRHDGRAALAEALAAFERLDAPLYVAATQAELRHVGGRTAAGAHELTGTEARVARLVASGLSNKETAAELFVAVSTVEATLTRIYRKLGVKSRSQLTRARADRTFED